MMKELIKGTLLSVLIFFSISFITVLTQINSPFHRIEGNYKLSIGFPFEYYYEFLVELPTPNSGWNVDNLIIDCLITWLITIGIRVLIKKIKTK